MRTFTKTEKDFIKEGIAKDMYYGTRYFNPSAKIERVYWSKVNVVRGHNNKEVYSIQYKTSDRDYTVTYFELVEDLERFSKSKSRGKKLKDLLG
jgi:hypothetical protein